MTITINNADLKRLERKLGTLGAQRELRKPMTVALNILQDDMAKAPRKDKTAFKRLATKKQKQAFWARVGAGEIDIGPNGYKRTDILTQRWTQKIRASGSGLIGVLGNNTKYGPFVQRHKQPGGQQPYHAASRWRTDKQAIDTNRKEIVKGFQWYIRRKLAE